VPNYQSPAQEWLAENKSRFAAGAEIFAGNAVPSPLPDSVLLGEARSSGLREMGVRPALPYYISAMWRRRSFIWSLSSSKAYAKNQGSYLGQAWNVLRPLLDAAVYVIVFGFFFHTGAHQANVITFITVGTFIYAFLQRMITAGVDSIPKNLQLIRSHQFPRVVISSSACLTEAVLFVPGFIVMIAICFLSSFVPGMNPVFPRASWLLLPIAAALTTAFGLGLGLFLARLGAHTPDIANIVPFFISLGRFGSGVMFSVTAMLSSANRQGWLGFFLRYQPFAVFLDLVRACLGNDPATPMTAQLWVAAILWALVALIGGFVFFWGSEQTYGRN